ncbi:retinol dehydrogenase 8-like isoform X3 [Rhineura floridana]|uniref:retinol dehydrogenase 8-like isoform X3 n=1 Tax=Rhineura floridana TaxID=261503 RepID=UPI002AC81B80|nr:retinol dehydrogenase 8-like isoform X3 [Rhineura floridana]
MAVRNVLVTGCSSGIGLALALRLARDELKRFQVNSAGLGMIGPVESQSIASAQRLFDTNFFGLVRLIQEVFPDMKRQKQGHVVVMSSVLGLQGLLFNDIYSASKFAVEGFCESLALQALKFGINADPASRRVNPFLSAPFSADQKYTSRISLIEPGPVITEFERKLYEDVANMDLSAVDKETLDMFQGFYMTYSKEVFTALGQSPEEVAEHAMKVITSEKPPFRYQTNSLYTPITTLKHADPTGNLPLNAFHQMIFQHDRLFKASLSLLKMLQWRKRRDMDCNRSP